MRTPSQITEGLKNVQRIDGEEGTQVARVLQFQDDVLTTVFQGGDPGLLEIYLNARDRVMSPMFRNFYGGVAKQVAQNLKAMEGLSDEPKVRWWGAVPQEFTQSSSEVCGVYERLFNGGKTPDQCAPDQYRRAYVRKIGDVRYVFIRFP